MPSDVTEVGALLAPVVSVVVPTYRRPRLMQRCLRAIVAQTVPAANFEILVVDDGHCDETRAAVAEVAASRPDGPAIRYLRPTDGRGPAVARNTGWRAARGAIIAFTDDDTLPEPQWLEHGERALRPGVVAVAGRVRVPVGPRPTDHERMTQGLEFAEFVTANAFVRADALRRVDGFDERFRKAWREDSDLQFRLQQIGEVGRADDAIVVHPVRAERWGVSLRQQSNVVFDALLYKKHPDIYRARIRRVPPWDYYVIVASTAVAFVAAAAGLPVVAGVLGLVALALVLRFAVARLRGAATTPEHVLEMLATSALIPFLSVYWRVRGALRWRVAFL